MENQPVTSPSLTAAIARAMLTDEYQAWTVAQNLPALSADELAVQEGTTPEQKTYLTGFMYAWELVEGAEHHETQSLAHIDRIRVELARELAENGFPLSPAPAGPAPLPTGESRKIALTLTLTDEFLADVMCGAFEGGTGYWAVLSNIERSYKLPDGSWVSEREAEEAGLNTRDADWRYLRASMADTEAEFDEETGEPVDVSEHAFLPFVCSYDLIARGIQIILDSTEGLNQQTREAIFRGVLNNDAGEIDAEAADAIVQFGGLGSLVFG